ncbi:hypothetical protein SPI_05668 [Niveomyces insectorum RCEF 264]|uniref:Uncharacterized protein n=1 Tax=Niveomyces insectorum RCEF 264 TaxID=1081102 RepID=A0A167TFE6_9HYPO|nr:hypothetical protein SPI_05668 [Niveomyces insectorum RCEF 264]
MASFLARGAFSRRAFSTTVRRMASHEEQALKTESKKNPEIMVLGGIMVAVFAGAGYYFGRSPTVSTSEEPVAKAGMPWETGSTEGKYQYYPGGDAGASPREAPSAVNVVVVPDVNLPKSLHDKYNKWGKDGY